MKAVAFDLGSKTGFAILNGERIECGTRRLSNATAGSRFRDFYHWLIETISTVQPEIVFFERVYNHVGTEAAHVYGAFMYILLGTCEERGIRCAGLSVSAIKKRLSGNGRASKSDMIAAARTLGYSPIDDNAADAVGILLCGLDSINAKAQEWPVWK